MITWGRTMDKQESRKREVIFQQEEDLVTIEQKDTISHPSILGQFLHYAASCSIIQDGR